MGDNAGTYLLVRRLHALTGLVFAFAFVFLFLVPYSTIFSGYELFNYLTSIAAKIPLLDEFEVVFILLPLIFHAIVGISIVHSSQFNVIYYGTYRNWMYAISRIAGLVLIPFVAYHVYFTRLVFAFSGRHMDYAYMQKLLSSPGIKTLYIAGILSAAIYIGCGFATELMRWGVTVSRRSQDFASMIMWALTIVLAIWGVCVVLAF